MKLASEAVINSNFLPELQSINIRDLKVSVYNTTNPITHFEKKYSKLGIPLYKFSIDLGKRYSF